MEDHKERIESFLSGFRDFAEISNQGIGICNLEGGVIYMNPTLIRMIEAKDLAEIQNFGYLKLYDQEPQQLLKTEIFPELFKRGDWIGELSLHAIKGSVVETRNKMTVLRNADGSPWLICNLVDDITQTNDLRRELELYKDQLEVLVNERTRHLILALSALKAGAFNYDLESQALSWDTQSCEIFEVKPEFFSCSFENWKDLIEPADLPQVLLEFEHALKNRGQDVFSLEYRLKKSTREVKHINTSAYIARSKDGRPKVVYGIHQDISSRKNDELILAKHKVELETEKMLTEALMENLPEFVYFKDKESRFIKVSHSMHERFSPKGESLIGKTDFDIHTREGAIKRFEQEQEIVMTGKPLMNEVEIDQSPSGEKRWVSTTKMPLYDRKGELI